MKRLNTLFIIFTFALSISVLVAKAQEFTNTNYYYNNFDGGLLGDKITQTGSNEVLQVSSSSPLSGSYSLASVAGGVVGSYQINGLTANSSLNSETFGYEWTMVYKNNGTDTDNSNVISSNKNAWKYWLFGNSSNLANISGYYLTQNGNTLSLVLKNGNDIRALLSYNISNNTAYAIRVQRILRQGSYVWQLFVDPYTSSKKEASTPRGGLNYEGNIYNTYNYSGLQIASTSVGRFQFDELKVYSMKLNISGANNSSYGVSNPLYPGLANAVIYGLKIETRGYFDIYQMKIALTGNITGIVEGTMKLNKSLDAYFGNGDDSFVANLSYYNEAIQNYNVSDTFYTLGEADGSLATAFYYYISVNVKASPTSGATFSISGTPELNGSSSQANYANTGSVVNVGTPATNTGNVRDWVGTTSTVWNVASNWSPNTVPGVNDLARIGVVTFTNQPEVSNNPIVGNIQFGTTKIAELKVNKDYTLTVNNSVENLEGIKIFGEGVLDIKGSYIAKPTAAAKTTTSEIATLNVTNLVLNTETRAVTFNATGANILVKNAIQTTGANAASFTLGASATLTLTGAVPITLGASTNTVTLNNGSTVVYAGTAKQTVNKSLAYKNITFSGVGAKDFGTGTLNVAGNWSSVGAKLSLTLATVSFNGTNQAITDAGSDSGNGVVFGNVSMLGGTKTLSSGKFALAIGRYLTLGENTTLQTSDNLTLKAGVLGSASVATIPSTSVIKGKVTVEKYVQGGDKAMWRSYRMFSSPVYDNTTTFVNTNEAGNRTYSFTQFIDDMLITGRSAGFDQLNNSATGAWFYDNGFIAIPSVNTSVNVGRGAYVLYRGDRTNGTAKVTSPYVDPESIIMNFKGTLNQQSITVPLVHGSVGYSFIGNPYAATIDWTLVPRSANVSSTIRIWNPEMKQYATHNGQHGINGGARYIGPGQGFFVQTTDNASPYVTFTEASKVSDVAQAAPLYNKVMSVRESDIATTFSSTSNMVTENPSQIRIKLRRDGFDNEDETLVLLKQNELATMSGFDVERTGGEAVFLSSLSAEGYKMGINYMPHISSVSVIKLDVSATNNGAYKMIVDLTDIPLGYALKLRDKQLNTFTDLNNEGTSYSLTIDKALAASMNDRFEIWIAPPTTLPVVLSDFNGAKTNDGVMLKWKTSLEANNNHFEVLRAGDNQAYSTLGRIEANATGNYQLLDKLPFNGNNYYKLVQVDKDGKATELPKLVTIKYELNNNLTEGVIVYPTLVESTFTLKFNGSLSSNKYVIKIADVTGKEVFAKDVDKDAIINGYVGQISDVAPGIYFATLIDLANGKKIGTAKLVKK